MTLAIVVAALTTIFVLGVGGWMTTIGPWYENIRKPSWTPPNLGLRTRMDRHT
jgi:benzodiazapine receptor